MKKRDNIYTIFSAVGICMFMFFWISCRPSREELDAIASAKANGEVAMRHVTITADNCGCSDYTATFYDVNGCEYVGQLNSSNHDVLAHSGQCKRCENRQIYLTDSIVKANLKQFFTVKQQ